MMQRLAEEAQASCLSLELWIYLSRSSCFLEGGRKIKEI